MKTPTKDQDWSLISRERAETLLDSPSEGLTSAEVTERLSQFGPNEIILGAGPRRSQITVAQ